MEYVIAQISTPEEPVRATGSEMLPPLPRSSTQPLRAGLWRTVGHNHEHRNNSQIESGAVIMLRTSWKVPKGENDGGF